MLSRGSPENGHPIDTAHANPSQRCGKIAEVDGCLADDTIARLIDGGLPETDRAAVHAHIDDCAACRALVADVVRDDAAGDAPLPPGSVLGRYVVVTGLSGAMTWTPLPPVTMG